MKENVRIVSRAKSVLGQLVYSKKKLTAIGDILGKIEKGLYNTDRNSIVNTLAAINNQKEAAKEEINNWRDDAIRKIQDEFEEQKKTAQDHEKYFPALVDSFLTVLEKHNMIFEDETLGLIICKLLEVGSYYKWKEKETEQETYKTRKRL